MYGSSFSDLVKWLKCILQLLCLAQHAWTPAVSILLELWDYIKRIVSLFYYAHPDSVTPLYLPYLIRKLT